MVLHCRKAYRITNLTANRHNKYQSIHILHITTNNRTIGFVEEVSVIWHVNITKNIVFRICLAKTHIVLYIRIVRIWYNVRISIDNRSYIVRISRKRKR